jgi:hypothetical protein
LDSLIVPTAYAGTPGRASDPIHAIVGGFQMPVTDSPLRTLGIRVLMFIGTGEPFWERITEDDPMQTIAELQKAEPVKVPRDSRASGDLPQ